MYNKLVLMWHICRTHFNIYIFAMYICVNYLLCIYVNVFVMNRVYSAENREYRFIRILFLLIITFVNVQGDSGSALICRFEGKWFASGEFHFFFFYISFR